MGGKNNSCFIKTYTKMYTSFYWVDTIITIIFTIYYQIDKIWNNNNNMFLIYSLNIIIYLYIYIIFLNIINVITNLLTKNKSNFSYTTVFFSVYVICKTKIYFIPKKFSIGNRL